MSMEYSRFNLNTTFMYAASSYSAVLQGLEIAVYKDRGHVHLFHRKARLRRLRRKRAPAFTLQLP